MKKLNLHNALSLMYDVWGQKLKADRTEDRADVRATWWHVVRARDEIDIPDPTASPCDPTPCPARLQRKKARAIRDGVVPSRYQHFGKFCMLFLLTKFGLPSLRDA